MNKKHQKTLAAIFANPVKANILWKDIESLFLALGAEVSEGSGSRVRVALNGIRAIFHRPIQNCYPGSYEQQKLKSLD